MPVVGFINGGAPGGSGYLATAFRQGLKETGYVEGRNFVLEVHWTEGKDDPSPLVAELVRRQLALIVVGGGRVLRQAAKAATTTIPIVFVTGADPIAEGLVASM